MKNKLIKFIFPLLFLAGLSLLLYPLISNEWNDYRQSKLISTYDEEVAVQSSEGKIDYAGEKAAALAYNENLLPYVLPDSFAEAASREEPSEEYMSCLNLTGDGMMGYVEIPKIGVKIPVYHTTDEDVLERAAGHLEGSSLPVGGEGTHAVISAHRGLPSAALFTDLDQLAEGDYFFLSVLDDRLCYMVDHISIVEPSDTSGLAAEEGTDLVTLMTCTPYGVNSPLQPPPAGTGEPGGLRGHRGYRGGHGGILRPQHPYQLSAVGCGGAGGYRSVHPFPLSL